jgi:hypothetical protein
MHRVRKFLLYPAIAIVPALGMMMGFGSAAGASTAGTPATHEAAAAAIARAAIKQLDIGQHATDQTASRSAHGLKGLTQVNSTNWSGYADTGSNFTAVSGNWTEPGVSCTSTTSLAAFWVGIDGYSSASVEQDGTLIECYDSAAYQFSWWEMYPTNDIQVVGESVVAGDKIAASVNRSGTSYTLKVTDSTHTANSFTKVETCSSCANSSAEWIAEAPAGSSGVYPLSNFGSWTLTNSDVTEGSTAGIISSFTDDEITMIDSSNLVKAQPGALSGGSSFTVTWKRAS